MDQPPKKMNRRKFIYAGLGALVVIFGGLTAYFATRPPEVVERTIERTITGTPTTVVQTITVEKPIEKTVVTTVSGTPTTIIKTETLTSTQVKTVSTTIEKPVTVGPTIGPFTIWVEKGYAEAEDKAWDLAISTFKQISGIKEIELSRIVPKDFPIKIHAAVEGGNPPDYSSAHVGPTLQHAFMDKLEDMTEIIEPVKDRITPAALKQAYMWNNVKKKYSYYGVPWSVTSYFLHIWRDLIEKAGYIEEAKNPREKIPKDWDGFNEFFKDVQKKLRARGLEIYGLGYPLSTASLGDGPNLLGTLYWTMGGETLRDGKFVMDEPKNRRLFIKAVDILSSFVKEGYTPLESLTWGPPDNNIFFNTKKSVTMWNGTMSIPMYIYGKNPNSYYKELMTIEAPKGPNGEEWVYMVESHVISVVYKDSKNKEAGKAFARYMLEPDPELNICKAMVGRVFPARIEAGRQMKEGFPGPHGEEDPNMPQAYRQIYLAKKARVAFYAEHPALTEMTHAGAFTDTFARVIHDNWDPEKAVDEALDRAKRIWEKWMAK
jgi:multiple sugar transport system substrate-binding protein